MANQLPPIPNEERRQYAKACLENGQNVSKKELTALAQAKLDYVKELLQIVLNIRCKIFASIYVSHNSQEPLVDFLRKDYVYFFERFFYFLEDQKFLQMGAIVFDEIEKSASHILLSQIENYFKKTDNGRERSSYIIPEPFFVHSDLTSGIQIADIVAYVICWGYRLKGMSKPIREELSPYVELIKRLRHKTFREVNGQENYMIWSINVV